MENNTDNRKNSIDNKEKAEIILQNILTRTSDRMFDPSKEVGPEDLQTILQAAMAAPTAVNRQPWQFVVVTNRDLLNQMAEALPYCHMANQATAAIVVCGDKARFLEGDDDELWVQDVSAASENILLASHALGLGSVWTCLYPHPDREEATRRVLDIPDDLIPFNLIPIGFPLTDHRPMDKWHPERVHHNKMN